MIQFVSRSKNTVAAMSLRRSARIPVQRITYASPASKPEPDSVKISQEMSGKKIKKTVNNRPKKQSEYVHAS